MKSDEVSFLLGAGFSKPAGYPLASEINNSFVGLKADEFTIHSDGTAWFQDGDPLPNDSFMNKKESVFAEKLLDYYVHGVESQGYFDYEDFYDWYKDLLRGEEHDSTVESIAADLKRRTRDLLLNFDLTFNQLLADELREWYPAVHKARGLPRSHANFLELVDSLASEGLPLHFHSLNHDLFFESLSSTDVMSGELEDGFSELGSPFYGRLEVFPDGKDGRFVYKIRLPVFTGHYDSQFNLYKLHGSVDFYTFNDDGEQRTLRCKRAVRHNELMKEVGEGVDAEYKEDTTNYHPSFLSGTTYKTLKYDSTPYYEAVFDHFMRNLESSDVLIVIGYGFGDAEINRMLENCFCDREGTYMFIIDVEKPNVGASVRCPIDYFSGGVEEFDHTSVLKRVRCKM